MSSQDVGSVTRWFGPLKAGDHDAARQLVQRYFEALARRARDRLRDAPRTAENEEDVALSTLDSFCRGVKLGRFPQLDDRHALWRILVKILDRQAADQMKRELRHWQKGFDLRLMSWGDGSGVLTSGKNLVIVGIDSNGLLHIRIYDAAGSRITDTDETKLPAAQAAAIAILKQQLPGLLPPHVLTYAEKAQVISEATSIVGQTRQKRDATPLDLVTGSEPSPELAVMEDEEFLRRLDGLGDETLRYIAWRKMLGDTDEEIAARLGCARRTVVRKIVLIRQALKAEVPP